MAVEVCIPNPEYLIKSIAEQGYTFETSIADLIDNSISAGALKIEVLVDTQTNLFQLFISDNGSGMSEIELQQNLQFPSSSPDDNRKINDLGRFGLGMKTASFSQTRCFTVISRTQGSEKFFARTWDVNHLKKSGKWEILINSDEEINELLIEYYRLNKGFLNQFKDYVPNTIIVWNGLYKFEKTNDREIQSDILQKELTKTVKEYLQIIFHRFMEKNEPLQIRINNDNLIPFNPFPANARQISTKQKSLLNDRLKLAGYVLPNESLIESKGISEWTLTDRSLMDMEGMYIYRADRLIVFGGWNGAIKKSPRLQLARLKVEIGNGIDHLFHLNVAKSIISIPFGERIGFMRYVNDLKIEAEKEYYNFEIRSSAIKSTVQNVFLKIPTNHGMALGIDENFPLLKELTDTLTTNQQLKLKIIFRMITTAVNKIKKVHIDENYSTLLEKNVILDDGIVQLINSLLASGFSKGNILNEIIPTIGIEIQSLPASVLSLLQ